MRLWLPERETYLLEMLRLEGCVDQSPFDVCPGKPGCLGVAIYRCRDCHGSSMYCKECTVCYHQRNPLHRIQQWNGQYFERVTLKDMGLRIQLGHPVGSQCYSPTPSTHGDFVVLDTQGVHLVALDYCNCESAVSHTRQLLRVSWYPATATDPKSGCTFRMLEHFQMLSFESKGSAFEYYRTISRLTDNCGLLQLKDRYEALLRMVRQFRHLRSLKRSGRGHDASGIEGTQEGACAVICPACPQPGRNFPTDWKHHPADQQWLYALFVASDANFRMDRLNKSSEAHDPSLGAGWQYFMEQTKFKVILDKFAHLPQEKSTCVSHNTVNLADTRDSRGKAATGIGTTDCARHNFKLPTSVGDLQKGERYVNMDYFFFQSLRHNPDIMMLNVSYDIACQWSKNLRTRMIAYGTAVNFNYDAKRILFLVPKFHLPAHVMPCQTRYSFNLMKGVGRTDGEAVERGWANINPAASSTREMGPGSRHDTLDDHFGDWNWKKLYHLGVGLCKKLKVAMGESTKHVSDFLEFQQAVSEGVAQWQIEVEEWEADRTKPNPFETEVTEMSQPSVRLAMAEEEAAELARGVDHSLHPDVSPSILISAGLDLEEQQRRLAIDIKETSAHATDSQRSTLQQRSNSLRRKIEQWSNIQQLYMPVVARLRMADDIRLETADEAAHDAKLYLPSQILSLSPPLSVNHTFSNFEWDLRCAQAADALNDLCYHVHLSSYLWGFKDRNIRGQHPNTRARGVIDNVATKIDLAKARYRRARTALVSLAPALFKGSNWENTYCPLQNEDVRVIKDGLEGDSEGRRSLSWIWRSGWVIQGDGSEGLLTATKVEWCRARARANRWTEEVMLLREEMQRVLAYLEWQACWWDQQPARRTAASTEPTEAGYEGNVRALTPDEATGAVAYARRQAATRRAMRDPFQAMWMADHELLTSPVSLVATSSTSSTPVSNPFSASAPI
ncbi:hypothetical protein BJ138DRAFT_1017239 [Hygrophoropsis aurantiaca]|uniref:Uncharacterized protein n=1 Tax=Hygrophoropsis aurantiaca TaxID=72124 RepID=A0ACB7ZXL5_9AGAM|nr:hypothetical protein BJ138DRAFT_1017239 [Hygrophoropsis aurantiaca]